MKLLFYGASVTAQKFETGYYQQIEQSSLTTRFSEIERIAFGASQFEFAGYAFMQDAISIDADVCVIDWLTPSMPSFTAFKIPLLNYALLKSGCLPVWVFFPRTSNFDALPEAYNQVKKSCEQFGLPFIDVRPSMKGFIDEPSRYLRDAVHTTLEGAKLYSDIIEKSLSDLDVRSTLNRARESDGFVELSNMNYQIPVVNSCELTINDQQSLELEFSFNGGLLEIFFDTFVGPHLCLLKFEVILESNVVHCETINPADRWSHYKRKMVVETLRKRLKSGQYIVRVHKLSGDPFSDIETVKPLQEQYDNADRFVELNRISLNAESVKVRSNTGN
ncbi:MAG: hypothetical protein Alis3KO_25820 [Aliiglaciecola sp.]